MEIDFERVLSEADADRVRQFILFPTVEILDFPMVIKDDRSMGNLADALTKKPEEKAEIMKTLISYDEASRIREEHAEDIAAKMEVESLNGELEELNTFIELCDFTQAWTLIKKGEARVPAPKWAKRRGTKFRRQINELEQSLAEQRRTVALGYARQRI